MKTFRSFFAILYEFLYFFVMTALLSGNLFPLVLASNYNGAIQGYGVDTVAGYSTWLTTSKSSPGRDLVFSVKKPDGLVLNIPVKTNNEGVAKTELYDYHTGKAGVYTVTMLNGTEPVSDSSVFNVYPDKVSSSSSTIVSNSTVAKADGDDLIYLVVTLRDQYNNSFEGHSVKIISSRTDDIIVSKSAVSNNNGSATFAVSSDSVGVSVYSAIDTTSGVVLDDRVQVAYLTGDTYMSGQDGFSGIGGPFDPIFPVAMAAGNLNHFSIDGFPSYIKPGQDITFSISANDQDDQVVENYTGVVRFSADGSNSDNVLLPEDFTFKADDLGTHDFSLGLKFLAAGTYTLVVTDVNNTIVKGEKTIVVGEDSGSGSSDSINTSSSKPSITTPLSGDYSLNVQTVSGSAPAGMTVKIFDNDQEIGSVQAGQDGSYSYQSVPLADGDHSIYVVTVNGSNTVVETSSTVDIKVDTAPPLIDDLVLDPKSGLSSGELLNIKLFTEPELSQSACIFNDDIIDLTPSLGQDGVYTASLEAPKDAGEYGLDFLLVDELGNEVTYKDKATIIVSDDGTAGVTQETSESLNETQETVETQKVGDQPFLPLLNSPPSQVFGIIAYGSDSRVTLVWEAAVDDNAVDYYKVYYGLDPSNLESSVDTKDASTTWYIPNLENGKEYYFAVAAVDDESVESEKISTLVNAIPFKLDIDVGVPLRPDFQLGVNDEAPALRGAANDEIPPEMAKNGPEVLWLFFGTGLFAGVARKVSRKRRRLQK